MEKIPSRIIYREESLIAGTRGGLTVLNQPIVFTPNKRIYGKVLNAAISKRIPNIYSYGGVTTNTLYLSNDGFTGSNELITLPTGTYTLQYIEAALIEAMINLSWITSSTVSDSPIQIEYNLASNYVYMTLDSTKLLAGTQIGINFSSSISTLLGFTSPSTFNTDGLKTANALPNFTYQGNYVDITVSFARNASTINSAQTQAVATINLNASNTGVNEFLYPQSSSEPFEFLIQTNTPNLSEYTISVVNGSGTPIYFQEGSLFLEMVLYQNA